MNDWLLILGMSFITFGTRYIPFCFAGKVKIPILMSNTLRYVPIAVLTSIIAQSSIIREGEIMLNISNHYLLATVASFVNYPTPLLGIFSPFFDIDCVSLIVI